MAKRKTSNGSGSGRSATGAATKRHARGTGATHVYDRLREEILNLRIEPGTFLDETELADRFRLSRSPVREALIRLSAEGLVQTLRNRSPVVASFDISAVSSYVDAIELMYRVTTRLAALNRTDAQLEAIRTARKVHAAAVARNDIINVISANRDFHAAIADAAGNSFFATWVRTLLDQGQRILRLHVRALGDRPTSKALGEHEAIVAAIEKGDPDAAEEAARRDAIQIADKIMQQLAAIR
jgi:DNA-binding GntR family transcriptional regulator